VHASVHLNLHGALPELCQHDPQLGVVPHHVLALSYASSLEGEIVREEMPLLWRTFRRLDRGSEGPVVTRFGLLPGLEFPQGMKSVDLGLMLHPLLSVILEVLLVLHHEGDLTAGSGSGGLRSQRLSPQPGRVGHSPGVVVHHVLEGRERPAILLLLLHPDEAGAGATVVEDQRTVTLGVGEVSSGLAVRADECPEDGAGDEASGSPQSVTSPQRL